MRPTRTVVIGHPPFFSILYAFVVGRGPNAGKATTLPRTFVVESDRVVEKRVQTGWFQLLNPAVAQGVGWQGTMNRYDSTPVAHQHSPFAT